jgi:hypothetical protein
MMNCRAARDARIFLASLASWRFKSFYAKAAAAVVS